MQAVGLQRLTRLTVSLRPKRVGHAQAFPTGEMKHGQISLVDDQYIRVVLLPEDKLMNCCLQLLALCVAEKLGRDTNRRRNLAKSVSVEYASQKIRALPVVFEGQALHKAD